MSWKHMIAHWFCGLLNYLYKNILFCFTDWSNTCSCYTMCVWVKLWFFITQCEHSTCLSNFISDIVHTLTSFELIWISSRDKIHEVARSQPILDILLTPNSLSMWAICMHNCSQYHHASLVMLYCMCYQNIRSVLL